MTVGALRPPSCPRMPFGNFSPSVKPNFGSWQLAQEIVLSAESRLSKKSSQPSSAFSAEYSLPFGQGMATSPLGTFGPSLGKSRWSASAERDRVGTKTSARTETAARDRRVEGSMGDPFSE